MSSEHPIHLRQGFGSLVLLALIPFLHGCSSSVPPDPLPAPPWAGQRLAPSEAPAVLLAEWGKAENREICAPITFVSSAIEAAAVPRRASFSGGWAVAWDLPDGPGTAPTGAYCPQCGRGAFGIAGTGVEPGPDTYDDWPHERIYDDGSRVGYGPRDDQWLAYVEIAGQRCLYNVWSYRGQRHLESLIDEIRFVNR